MCNDAIICLNEMMCKNADDEPKYNDAMHVTIQQFGNNSSSKFYGVAAVMCNTLCGDHYVWQKCGNDMKMV